jgi:hypothetical protein
MEFNKLPFKVVLVVFNPQTIEVFIRRLKKCVLMICNGL